MLFSTYFMLLLISIQDAFDALFPPDQQPELDPSIFPFPSAGTGM